MIKGKIVLIPFPFDDLTTSKARPAACLTNSIGPHRHVVLAFITSRITENRLETDLVLNPAHDDFAATGLIQPSTLRLHRLMTATTTLIRRELGVLSRGLQAEIDGKLRTLFGL